MKIFGLVLFNKLLLDFCPFYFSHLSTTFGVLYLKKIELMLKIYMKGSTLILLFRLELS